MTALYAIVILLEVLQPRIEGPEPALQLVTEDPGLRLQLELLLLVSWWVPFIAWIVTYTLGRIARSLAARRRWRAAGAWIVVGVLLAPHLVQTPAIVGGSGAWAVGCAVTTAVGLFLITRLQRFDRMSWWILVCALGWGALIATGFALGFSALVNDFLPAYTFTGDVSIAGVDAWRHQAVVGQIITAGFGEELAKGAGIVLVCGLFRHRLTGVVSGIVIGASVGLGFNFSESLLFLARAEGSADVFQFYGRQGVSLMAAHLAFSAVVGAGVGLSLQLRRRIDKLAAIGAGYLLASCCHFATNVLLGYLSLSQGVWLPDNDAVYALVVIPVFFVVMHAPLVVLYLLMARSGLQSQAKGLAEQLDKEAATGYGAITPTEVPVLLSPRRRFRRKLLELRGHGLKAYRRLDRLYATQLRLGTYRWLVSRGDLRPTTTGAEVLRERAVQCKLSMLDEPTTGQPDTAGKFSMAGAAR